MYRWIFSKKLAILLTPSLTSNCLSRIAIHIYPLPGRSLSVHSDAFAGAGKRETCNERWWILQRYFPKRPMNVSCIWRNSKSYFKLTNQSRSFRSSKSIRRAISPIVRSEQQTPRCKLHSLPPLRQRRGEWTSFPGRWMNWSKTWFMIGLVYR